MLGRIVLAMFTWIKRILDPARCEERNVVNGARCELKAGHWQKHVTHTMLPAKIEWSTIEGEHDTMVDITKEANGPDGVSA